MSAPSETELPQKPKADHTEPQADDTKPLADDPANDAAEEPEMEYFRAWTYLFEAPSWRHDILMTSVASLVPILGKLAVDGFLWERAGVATGQRPGAHAAFNSEFLSRYLQRGIWPFVVSTLLNIVTQASLGLLILLFIVGIKSADLTWLGKYSERELTILVYSVGVPVMLLLLAAVKLVFLIGIAMTLHSERTCEFRAIFDFEFVRGFIYRVWLEGILVITYVALVAPFVLAAGLLCCVVGMFPAMILCYGANEFLFWRLYKLYLARGGKPIAITEVE